MNLFRKSKPNPAERPALRVLQFVRAIRMHELGPENAHCQEARLLAAMAPPSTPEEQGREAMFVASVEHLTSGDLTAFEATKRVLAAGGELHFAEMAFHHWAEHRRKMATRGMH